MMRVYWEIQLTRNLVMKMSKILILFSSDSLQLSSEDDDTNACNADENVSLESELGEWQSKHKFTREALKVRRPFFEHLL